MATVDGVAVKPDSHGVVQGNGGDIDKMAGGSGNDTLEGHADFNQYYGGAGTHVHPCCEVRPAGVCAHHGVR